MSQNGQKIEKRLDQVEVILKQLVQSSIKLESRVEIIQQDLQRSATQLHRLGINQESAKLSAQRHEAGLKSVKNSIDELRNAVLDL